MAKQKTTWECGHRGYGSRCHACAQALVERARIEESRLNKKAQLKALASESVDLSSVPKAYAEMARDIIRRVSNGVHWSQCGGRRIRAQRQLVVFELGKHWRLVGEDIGVFRFKAACSHQEYNTLLRGH